MLLDSGTHVLAHRDVHWLVRDLALQPAGPRQSEDGTRNLKRLVKRSRNENEMELIDHETRRVSELQSRVHEVERAMASAREAHAAAAAEAEARVSAAETGKAAAEEQAEAARQTATAVVLVLDAARAGGGGSEAVAARVTRAHGKSSALTFVALSHGSRQLIRHGSGTS